MRGGLVFLFLVYATLPLEVQAQDPGIDLGIAVFEDRLRDIEDDIDSVNATQDAKMADLERSVDELRRRIERFNEDYEQLQSALNVAETLRTQLTTLTTDVATAKDDATKAYEAANSVRWIVSISAILITGMTAALGLLFSQRFIDLKADARVAQEVLTRVEKRIDATVNSDQVLTRIEKRVDALFDAQRDKKA